MKKIVALCVLIMSFHGIAQANYEDTDKLPSKPMSQHVMPVIKLLNSLDEDKMKEYIQTHFTSEWSYSSEQSVEFLRILANSYGKLKFHSSLDYQTPLPDEEIVAILYSELTESWLAATFIGNNSKIEIFDISPAKRPSNLPPVKPQSLQQAAKKSANYAKRMANKDVFSGTALIAHKGDVLWQGAFGHASKRFDVNNQLDTRFDLASVSKLFTGVAITKLVEQGKIKFDDKVENYLSNGWINPEYASQISVEQLLNHTSGLSNSAFNHADLYAYSRKRFESIEDFKVLIKSEPLNFKPGTGMQYSNTAVFLAGVIVQNVSGLSYYDFIKKYVFEPANMSDSGYFEASQPYKRVAIGYERNRKTSTGWKNSFFERFIKGSPAGGAISTVGDMHKFGLALLNNTFFGEQLTQKLISFYQYPSVNYMSHAGGHFGTGANFELHPESGIIAVVLSNYTNGATNLASKITSEFSLVER